MTKQLNLTSLLLLVTSLTFAQQSIVNTSRSNIKDKVAVDTAKKPVTPTTQAAVVTRSKSNVKNNKLVMVDSTKTPVTPTTQAAVVSRSKSNIKDNKLIMVDSTKTPVTTTEQARTASNIIPGVGTVVKKNPGGGASRVGATNDKGEVVFTIKEKGDYTITLVNDGGGTATSNNNAAAMSKGGPVQGVKVGLGKNPPGGSTHFATTNDKGEAEFKNLEVGSYKIVVEQADRTTNTTKPAQN